MIVCYLIIEEELANRSKLLALNKIIATQKFVIVLDTQAGQLIPYELDLCTFGDGLSQELF